MLKTDTIIMKLKVKQIYTQKLCCVWRMVLGADFHLSR